MLRGLLIRSLALLMVLGPWVNARASQYELIPPTTGTYTGVQFSQLLGDANRSMAGCNIGPTAPANVSGMTVDGLCWIDNSGTPWIKKRYANGGWVVEGAIDQTNGYWVGVLGGGVTSLASSATTELGSVQHANITITGTTDITSLGTTAPTGTIKIIRFADALWLTYSSSLTVPGGYSVKTAANDRAIVTHLGSGVWEVTQYTRANGIPLDISAVATIKHTMYAAETPDLHVAGRGQALTRTTYPAYTAKVSRAQSMTRTSGSPTITALSDATDFGSGMPIEGTGIPAGTTISSISGATITMSANATSSGTSTATVYLTGYGSAGDSTTVGIPDCRGNMIAGLDSINGFAASRITTAGSGINGAALNVSGGSQTKITISQANLPSYTLPNTLTVTPSGTLYKDDTAFNSAQTPGGISLGFNNNLLSVTFAVGGSVTSGGGGTAIDKMPPILTAKCFIRVTP